MFLVDDYRHAQVFDGVGVWLSVAWQEVTDERAEGFVQLAARFGGNGIENDGRFTRPGHTGKDSDLALRNAQRDVLQVVFTGAANLDVFLGHEVSSGCFSVATDAVTVRRGHPARRGCRRGQR